MSHHACALRMCVRDGMADAAVFGEEEACHIFSLTKKLNGSIFPFSERYVGDEFGNVHSREVGIAKR